MEISLQRKENERYYLYGSICEGDEWVCDSLEFGSGCQLQAGTYILKNLICPDTRQKVIGIYNVKMELVSKMIKDNCSMYHSIKIRNENNYICLGFRVNSPLLTMYEHSFRIISNKITTCEYYGEQAILHIKDIKTICNTTR